MRYLRILLALLTIAVVSLLAMAPSSAAGWDSDGDGYWDSDETHKGSDPLDANSTPEHCDGIDNDGDSTVDEAPEGSGRPMPDPLCDPTADPDGDTEPNTSDSDDDNDGYSDVAEQYLTTDELAACPVTIGAHDAWPPDFDMNRVVNITDVFYLLPPNFGGIICIPEIPCAPWPSSKRIDLCPNGAINICDVFKVLPPVFGSSCTP